MPRVVFVYADRVGREMGGTGIRALELARAMSAHADVAIAAAATDGAALGVPITTFEPHRPHALEAAVRGADMIVAQPQWPPAMRILRRAGGRLVFDLYDPEVFGTLQHFADRPAALRRTMAAFAADRVDAAMRLGDRLICGSERQRELYRGELPAQVEIGIVPFGVPTEPPAPGPGPREVLGLGDDAEIALWNGGIWSWFDAPGAIRAVARLRELRPAAQLVFMGASSAPPARRAAEHARSVAAELGLLGDGVHFHDAWVPYEQRGGWLLGADCAVSAHLDDLESRYAHRTRLLDCFWARLPIVCTTGDELAARVEREDLGATAPPGDPDALAAAMARVLAQGRAAYRDRLAAAAADHEWSRVIAPLVRWLDEPAPPRQPRRPRSPATVARGAAYSAVGSTASLLRLRPPKLG